jgi:hypothetical protein
MTTPAPDERARIRAAIDSITLASYENPDAIVLCLYKSDRALCHLDGFRDTLSLHRCVPGCENIARTD